VARIKASRVPGGLFGGPKRTRGNEYRAVPTVHGGVRYGSRAEAERAAAPSIVAAPSTRKPRPGVAAPRQASMTFGGTRP
jgi:hypothetical protein